MEAHKGRSALAYGLLIVTIIIAEAIFGTLANLLISEYGLGLVAFWPEQIAFFMGGTYQIYVLQEIIPLILCIRLFPAFMEPDGYVVVGRLSSNGTRKNRTLLRLPYTLHHRCPHNRRMAKLGRRGTSWELLWGIQLGAKPAQAPPFEIQVMLMVAIIVAGIIVAALWHRHVTAR